MSETKWEGRYLAVREQDGWEWAERKGRIGAAVVVALDGDDVLLIEQYRKPVGKRCLELPAGLVGDDRDGESVADAARRELEEETGYRAEIVEELGNFYSSPGMTSEAFTVVRATGLTQVGEGGGEGSEDITVHRVARTDIAGLVREKREADVGIDAKLLLLLGFDAI